VVGLSQRSLRQRPHFVGRRDDPATWPSLAEVDGRHLYHRSVRQTSAPVPPGRHRHDQDAGVTGLAVYRQRCCRSGHRCCRLPRLRKAPRRLRKPPRRGAGGRVGGVNRRSHADQMRCPCPMAAGASRITRYGRVRRAAVRKVGCDGRRARPCLISRLVDRRPYRRRKPGTRLRHLRPMRRGHVPGERDHNPYQHGADCGREPRPTAGTEEPSRSRPSMHSISPWHGTGAYHRAEATRVVSPEGN